MLKVTLPFRSKNLRVPEMFEKKVYNVYSEIITAICRHTNRRNERKGVKTTDEFVRKQTFRDTMRRDFCQCNV